MTGRADLERDILAAAIVAPHGGQSREEASSSGRSRPRSRSRSCPTSCRPIDYGGDIRGLLVVSLIAGVVNGLIGPIVKLLSLPLNMMTLGLFGLVINAGAAAAHRLAVRPASGSTFTVGDFPPDFSADTIVTAVIGGVAISLVGSLVGMVVRD